MRATHPIEVNQQVDISVAEQERVREGKRVHSFIEFYMSITSIRDLSVITLVIDRTGLNNTYNQH